MKTRSVSDQATILKTSSRDRRGTRPSKEPAVATKGPVYADPSACQSCGAFFTKRTWRRDHRVTDAMLAQAEWAKCPACRQKHSGTAYGRVAVRGIFETSEAAALRRRIVNVGKRAEHTQPEHRVMSIERTDQGLEVLTTCQSLAHRIVHEFKKAFGGRASYTWSASDGSLEATWRK